MCTEGAPAVNTEDDECKIITGKTVFDHIREKAKNFPVLELSSDSRSPSLETLTLIRKRTREKQLELDTPIEILEDKSASKDSLQTLVIPSGESVDLEPFFDKDPTPGNFLVSNSDAGESTFEILLLL